MAPLVVGCLLGHSGGLPFIPPAFLIGAVGFGMALPHCFQPHLFHLPHGLAYLYRTQSICGDAFKRSCNSGEVRKVLAQSRTIHPSFSTHFKNDERGTALSGWPSDPERHIQKNGLSTPPCITSDQ